MGRFLGLYYSKPRFDWARSNQTKPREHPAKKVRKEGKRLSWVEVEGPNFRSPVPTKKMNQRNSAAGRPSGTDGSDFAYRMVVDSRKFPHFFLLI